MATKDEIENEACRLLMISIYGSEAAATEAAQALHWEATPEEEARIKRIYDAVDDEVEKIFKDAQNRH